MDKIVNALSRIFDDGKDRTLSFFNEVDFDAVFDDMVERGKKLRKEINEAFKDFKESVTDFSVSVPFDEINETAKWYIENGILTVTVESNDGNRTSVTTATIPDACITENAQGTIDRKNGFFVVRVPKDNDHNEGAIKAVEKAKSACKGIFAPSKKPNVKKTYVRDSRGRFTAKK